MIKSIARNIALAQIASDGGKGIDSVCYDKISEKYYKKGYSIKDQLILKAIDQINRNKNSGFYYHVKYSHSSYQGFDRYGQPDWENRWYIIYFNFKVNGKRHQVSFHTYTYEDIETGKKSENYHMYEKYSKVGNCKARWDKKSSREAAKELIAIMQ